MYGDNVIAKNGVVTKIELTPAEIVWRQELAAAVSAEEAELKAKLDARKAALERLKLSANKDIRDLLVALFPAANG